MMSRVARGLSSGKVFHVMCQGIAKMNIFNSDEDKCFYIKKMFKYRWDFKIGIVAHCVMTNHVHLILNCMQIEDLSKFMQMLNTSYGVYYNKKNDRVGFVFKNRFKSQEIRSEEQFYTTVKYVHNNPVKAGMCKRPEDYPYSSYNLMYDKDGNLKRNVSRKIQELVENFGDVDVGMKILDVDDGDYYDSIVVSFLRENGISRMGIKRDKYKAQRLIMLLKDNCELSFKRIGELLGMNKDTMCRWYNEAKKGRWG